MSKKSTHQVLTTNTEFSIHGPAAICVLCSMHLRVANASLYMYVYIYLHTYKRKKKCRSESTSVCKTFHGFLDGLDFNVKYDGQPIIYGWFPKGVLH